MKSYDPSKPVSISNWPKGLKMPPLRRQIASALERPVSKPSEKPEEPATEPEERAPWWDCD